MTYKLKPCPFCGGKAVVVSNYNPERMLYAIQCHNHDGCDVLPITYESEDIRTAIEAWNRRVENDRQ